MDWATDIAARVQASLEGGPYVADDVEKIAAALRAEREACAALLETTTMADMQLAAGEMTDGERRTAVALRDWFARRIRARV